MMSRSKLGDAGEDREEHAAVGPRRSDGLFKRDEIDAQHSKLFQRVQQMARRARKAIESGDEHRVEPTAPSVFHQVESSVRLRPSSLAADDRARGTLDQANTFRPRYS
jgi:hypothetical protein